MDVSALFSRYRFPKLQRLHLYGCSILSWGLLKSNMALTSMELSVDEPFLALTLSQLLIILSSHPLLQYLALTFTWTFHTTNDERTSALIPLRHLKELNLWSGILRPSNY